MYKILDYKNPTVANALFLKMFSEVYETVMNNDKDIIFLDDRKYGHATWRKINKKQSYGCIWYK